MPAAPNFAELMCAPWLRATDVMMSPGSRRAKYTAMFATVRLISGTVANMAVYFALLEPGDIMTSVALSHGAHISSAKFGAAGMRGVNNVNYPFDMDRMNIDVDGTATLIKLVQPKLAAFGQTVFLFPTPLADLRDAFQEAGCTVWYDGAHVLGLIAGGQFQDPIHEGADVLTGSTHKTLPGPQHGILLSDSDDEKFIKRLQRAVFPGVVSNHHLHAMAASASPSPSSSNSGGS